MKINFKEIPLKEFLEYKTMYYDKIDFTIVQNSFDVLKKSINLPFIIHIVGTNGKGTTGRFLAKYLSSIGKDVLHYSSPHITNFNERIWINDFDVSDSLLDEAHKFLQKILDIPLLEKLTYFEYTTLLSFYLSSNRDYLILEAGLGGEFDGTNVATNDLSLITTIDLDHQVFLGNSIKEISLTKMRACDKVMIVGSQIHEEVYLHAKIIEQERDIKLLTLDDFKTDVSSLKNFFPKYLLKNISLVIAALKYLNIGVDIKKFENMKLNGRCEKYKNNITLDVGHNPLAARSILEEFENKKINLIYNSYADKDYKKVLEILKPIIKKLYILPLEDKRVVKKSDLMIVCANLNIITDVFKNEIKEDEEYLVFGSFLVIEKFLKIEKSLDEDIK
ncbi:MAG: bifunctional folylpolyglutamate synthase/dihydrofolate synthase [Arcobacter sp.]|uniref:bifunctional folylpolyglutamate synthase/dihydrofolate synthase n=1 Tax=Arcobacter sp. TaxID=1872629 RepID=UPI003C7863F4